MKKNTSKYADYEFSEEFRKELTHYWKVVNQTLSVLADMIKKNKKEFEEWLPEFKSYFENEDAGKEIAWTALSHISHYGLKKNGGLILKLIRKALRDTNCPYEVYAAALDVLYVLRPSIDSMELNETIKYLANLGKIGLIVIPGIEKLEEICDKDEDEFVHATSEFED